MATEHDFRDNPTRLTAKKGWITKVRPNGVVVATGILALLMLLPIAAVLSSLFDTGRGSLAHLASTILPDLVINTLGLVCMVGLGTAIVGTGTAWLVSACRFPGSRFLQWMLLLPLAMPAYIIGYAYTDFLVFAGPLQTSLRELFGWTRNDYWFPDIHSLWGVSVMLVLVLYPYVFFLARTAFQEQSRGLLDVARTLGRSPWNVFTTVALPMARPAIAAGGRAGPDGGNRRLWHSAVFWCPDLYHCHLPDMVRHGRQGRGGSTGFRPVGICVSAGGA